MPVSAEAESPGIFEIPRNMKIIDFDIIDEGIVDEVDVVRDDENLVLARPAVIARIKFDIKNIFVDIAEAEAERPREGDLDIHLGAGELCNIIDVVVGKGGLECAIFRADIGEELEGSRDFEAIDGVVPDSKIGAWREIICGVDGDFAVEFGVIGFAEDAQIGAGDAGTFEDEGDILDAGTDGDAGMGTPCERRFDGEGDGIGIVNNDVALRAVCGEAHGGGDGGKEADAEP